MSRARDPDPVRLTARSYETLAMDYPLAFPVPFGHLPGAQIFEATWHYIQYVFDLPDPSTFPVMRHTLTDEDIKVLTRYIYTAKEMAEGSFLRHPIKLHISFDSESIETTSRDFPHGESIRGFSVLFRQVYSNQEPASFNAVQRVLRAANGRAADGLTDQRDAQLRAWGRAVAQLRMHQVAVLVGRRLHRDGVFHHPEPFPGEETSPAQLISIYNYGEDIHWGRHREDLAVINSDSFLSAWERMSFFDAVAGLAHTFLGFSVLVDSAMAETTVGATEPPPASDH